MKHFDDETLDEYALDVEGTMRGRAEIEAHLNVCSTCSVRVGSTTAFLETITSPEVWSTAEAMLDPDSHERRIVAIATRVQNEYAAASTDFQPFLNDAVGFVRERVERRPEYRTAGAVRLLTETAHACCERDPIHSRNIAEAAVAIADQLPLSEYPEPVVQTLRGAAWKERANAMRFIGEYPEALTSLDRAERELRRLPLPSIELGNTAYIRAIVLTYMDRLDEAERFAAQSAEIFASFGDVDRWFLARSLEGGVLYYRSDFASALAVFERLLKHAEANSDPVEIARHAMHVGVCCIQIGRTARAAECLLVARQIHSELKNRIELLRIERWLGVLSRISGNTSDSIGRLRRARTEFAQLGLLDDAALATIDLVESLIVADQTSDIAKLCGEAMRYIRRAGNRRQALVAAAYLKEAADKRELTLRRVEHVREFIQRLEARPSLRFEPPVD